MKGLELLEKLSNLHGAPGFEDDVIEFMSHNTSYESNRDSINNLYLSKKNSHSEKPVVALDCHSDEVGFIVEGINRNGTISFLPLGGWHVANIPAHAVKIKNSKGEYIDGVVASKPPHFMTQEEMNRLPKLNELTIDIGTSSYKETVELYSIEVGNPITPDVTFKFDSKTQVMRGKAFDNRLGCGAVLEILEDVKDEELEVNVKGIVTAQEESGLRGAQVAGNKIKPDFIIIFEGSPADDTFKDEFSSKGAMGKGIQLRVVDSGMISNSRVLNFVKNIAKENNIPYQLIARSGGSTNGARYHTSGEGIPCIVIGMATRYIHTHYTFASLKDYNDAVLLGKKILEGLNKEILKNF
ncbi:M20/M25/M40 family metallo-hydrolase [uncultured Cetobacterium sp.]|uniref:M42 family metallopeptidase n=1 Tax=uncultured Cetobacterium sp. TaxID=527638 RepID=UPI002607A6AA|nr:M20/M25/M40 family metallo-hydrolase [uncultured Cetobacterium sp.]